MHRVSFVARACAIFLVAYGQSGTAAETRSPDAVSEFAATTGAFHQTLRANDLAGFASFLDPSAVIAPPAEPPIQGKNNVTTWYKSFLAKYRTSSLQLFDKENFVGRDWAVEFGRFSWGLSPTDGSTAVLDHGTYMQVWKRQANGSWRFAREVWNSSPPPDPKRKEP